ncbi:hypothetical protein AOT82_1047 [Psychrobacter sp. AntiMn-1]|nr:hypothetical protein AOT82_1047 [Psychrobacter sp. AntiMn-1]
MDFTLYWLYVISGLFYFPFTLFATKNPISGSQLMGSLLITLSYKDGHLSAIVHID